MRPKEPAEAMPVLQDGGYFELVICPKKVGSKRQLLRMKLRTSEGSEVDGAWGNAKKKLERQAKLTTVITGTVGQRWYLK